MELNEFVEHLKETKGIFPDLDGVDFFILVLLLSCALWSEDRKLADHGRSRVIATSELKRLISKAFFIPEPNVYYANPVQPNLRPGW